jgi:3-oxoacyl-[acyl-carrier-protein] synthase-3
METAAGSRILGTGHYVPLSIVTNQDVMKMMETTEEFVIERTGV